MKNEVKGIKKIEEFVKENMGEATKDLEGSFDVYGKINKNGKIEVTSAGVRFNKEFHKSDTMVEATEERPILAKKVVIKSEKISKAMKKRFKK